MTSDVQTSTLELLKRFNQAFPEFYEQFVSSEIQFQNLQLAFELQKTRQPVIQLQTEAERTHLQFACRNQSSVLSDIFGLIAAYGLTQHNFSLYGQVRLPLLVFLRLTLSHKGKALSQKGRDSLCRSIRAALADQVEVEKISELNLKGGLQGLETSFFIDPVFHLPALLVEAESQPSLIYRVMYAIWQEDLLVVNANFMAWRGRVRLTLYLMGPNGNPIPDYLGQHMAESIKQRLINPQQ
ncbi:MAG: hypothetical protein KME35_22100 [Aphanocapsa sp. GSE-SYN-MK-11-07L]|jgi:hypothetical protein|nr:hypothetical protein [Aphanocapsa sp. GSE-SYN-MK-11-07L]